jgi:hypothetical protein
VLILVPVFFAMMKERALRHGTLAMSEQAHPMTADTVRATKAEQ